MTTLPQLTPEEQRVLGSLLEKEVTVPASYPMTLNALRTACNQSNNREPVVDYDERTIQDAVRGLKEHGYARVTWLDRGRRTLKYAQSITIELGLADDERALLTVLLLRGPQAPGELRTRTERLFHFADRGAVEACLARMAEREQPLMKVLARRAGQQDPRWQHLLGTPEAEPESEPGVDRELLLADGAQARDEALLAAFDGAGEQEADASDAAFADAPIEWWLLTRVAELAGTNPVADVGCGAGGIAAYLAEAGAEVTGFDAAPGQVALARHRHPEVMFEEADLRRLLRPATAAGWGGVVAWNVVNHFAPSELASVLGSLTGPLVTGGVVALAFDAGAGESVVRHVAGGEVAWVAHDPAFVERAAVGAGLIEVECYLRLDAGRGYLLGRRG